MQRGAGRRREDSLKKVASRKQNGGKQNGGKVQDKCKDSDVGQAACATGDRSVTTSDSEALTCKVCDEVFTEEADKLVECERCDSWFCIDCSHLSSAEYDALSKKDSMMHWFCMDCNEAALSAVKTDNLIEEKCKKYFASFKEEIESAVQQDLDQIRGELHSFKDEQEKVNSELRGGINKRDTSMASISVNELKDREARQLNLVLFNVPESEGSNLEQSKLEDNSFLNKLFTQVLECQVSITSTTRLGKKSDKARPLRSTLATSSQVTSVLRAARKLGSTENERYKAISIKRDMTPLEREELRELIKLRDSRRHESDQKGEMANWVIRKGKVINIQRSQLAVETLGRPSVK